MTIAIALKINDGIVLATDSASTLDGEENEEGVRSVYHTYFTADFLEFLDTISLRWFLLCVY